ncbi:MAG: DinB family protein, partial [Pyrinomonadaceae bacterium]
MQATHQQKQNPVELLRFYEEVRAYTMTLCEPLETEDYIPQPSIDVSPPKWNVAHTTWFFEEMILKKFVENYQIYNKDFGFLFNSYYNSIGNRTRRDNRGDLSRPTVKEVFSYRKYVDEQMRGLLARDLTGEIKELIILGLNHEQQHQELFLTDLKYTLSINPLYPVYRENFALVEK